MRKLFQRNGYSVNNVNVEMAGIITLTVMYRLKRNAKWPHSLLVVGDLPVALH